MSITYLMPFKMLIETIVVEISPDKFLNLECPQILYPIWFFLRVLRQKSWGSKIPAAQRIIHVRISNQTLLHEIGQERDNLGCPYIRCSWIIFRVREHLSFAFRTGKNNLFDSPDISWFEISYDLRFYELHSCKIQT